MNTKNKKALSNIVTAMLVILLAIALISMLYIVINKTMIKASLSPEYLCFSLQTEKPMEIKKACINQQNETELLLKANKATNETIRFAALMNGESKVWSCGSDSCGCILPKEFESKIYYFPLKADEMTIMIGSCSLETRKVAPNC